jgi:hypothetical protein
MGVKTAQVRSSLSVRDCGHRFKTAIEKGRPLAWRLPGIEWFTPHDSSPFASLNDDQPDFAAGAVVAGSIRFEMGVWDRGDQREVNIVATWRTASAVAIGRNVAKMLAGIQSQLD